MMFLTSLFMSRHSCWRWCGALWYRGRSYPWLSQRILMTRLERIQRQFNVCVRGQGGHALIVHAVVLAESIPFFQIRSSRLSVRFRSLHLRVVYCPVSQLSPFHTQLGPLSVRAQVRWLKSCVELL